MLVVKIWYLIDTTNTFIVLILRLHTQTHHILWHIIILMLTKRPDIGRNASRNIIHVLWNFTTINCCVSGSLFCPVALQGFSKPFPILNLNSCSVVFRPEGRLLATNDVFNLSHSVPQNDYLLEYQICHAKSNILV